GRRGPPPLLRRRRDPPAAGFLPLRLRHVPRHGGHRRGRPGPGRGVGPPPAPEPRVTALPPVAGLLAGAASTALAMQPVAQTLGELSAFLGRPEAAARHFATAEQGARRWNSPHWTH